MTGPRAVLVVAESARDAREVQQLLDRSLGEQLDGRLVEWAVDQLWDERPPPELDELRAYVGSDSGRIFLDTHHIHKLATARRLVSHGHVAGRPPPIEYHQAREALRLARAIGAEVVVYLRDTDGEPERKRGWELAAESHAFLAVAGGFPHEAIEAWRLAAHRPSTAEEGSALKACQRRLGFDPVQAPERLSHKHPHPRSGKQVVEQLRADDTLSTAPLELLRSAGGAAGLPAFLRALDAVAVALLER